MIAAPPKLWRTHREVDFRSAVDHGPATGSFQLPCPGMLIVDGAEFEAGSPFVLACCDHCTFEIAVRRAQVEADEREDTDPDEREEAWWQR